MNKIMCVTLLLLAGLIWAEEDRHYIQDDDYFISRDRDLEGSTYIYVEIAKMIESATSGSKNEAKFMTVPDGNEVWTQYYWQSRPVQAEGELKLGTIVICSEASDNGIYIAPRNADESRINNRWFMAKIIDMTKMYKGIVKVSGGYDISRENLRLLGKGGFTPVKTGNSSVPSTSAASKQEVKEYNPPAKVNTGSSNTTGCGTLKIIKAVYGSTTNLMDVKDYIEEFCKNGQITATASDDFFNSSMDTDEDKNLYIRYQTIAGEFEVQVLQGETVIIPGKGHRRLK